MLGGTMAAPADSELLERFHADFSSHGATFSEAVRKDLGGAVAVLGVLQIRTHTADPGESGGDRFATQAGAYFTSDALRFPAFVLQPGSSLLKATAGLFGGMGSLGGLEFPGHPEFANAYLLVPHDVDWTRRLFDSTLLKALTSHPGWSVRSAPGSLLVFRLGRQCAPGEREAFAREAEGVFRLFEAAALRQEQAGGTLAAPPPGVIGDALRDMLVTRADMEAFVRMPPPREFPANVRNYRDGVAPPLAIGIGAAFTAVGTLFAFVLGQKGLGELAFSLVFVAVGAPLAIFLGLRWMRVTRLLRDGEVAPASVKGIEPAGWLASAAGPAFRLTVQFQAGGQARDAECNISEALAERVKGLASERKPVAVLYDTADPRRILCPEDMVNAGREKPA